MRIIIPDKLWLGHIGDFRDPALCEKHGIQALVHLALEELAPSISREITYCRYPLLDGAGHPPELAGGQFAY